MVGYICLKGWLWSLVHPTQGGYGPCKPSLRPPLGPVVRLPEIVTFRRGDTIARAVIGPLTKTRTRTQDHKRSRQRRSVCGVLALRECGTIKSPEGVRLFCLQRATASGFNRLSVWLWYVFQLYCSISSSKQATSLSLLCLNCFHFGEAKTIFFPMCWVKMHCYLIVSCEEFIWTIKAELGYSIMATQKSAPYPPTLPLFSQRMFFSSHARKEDTLGGLVWLKKGRDYATLCRQETRHVVWIVFGSAQKAQKVVVRWCSW